MLIPGIGSWYGGVTAAMELGKFLPILWKSVAGILGGDTSNMSSVKAGEAMRSYLSRFEGSTSDYGKTKLFGIESIGTVNVYELLRFKKLVFSKDALDAFIGRLA